MRIRELLFVVAAASESLTAQATGGSTMQAVPGGTITVRVDSNDSSIAIVNNSTGDKSIVPVGPGKDTQVQIPNVPGGTIVCIVMGRGLTAHIIVVEVIVP